MTFSEGWGLLERRNRVSYRKQRLHCPLLEPNKNGGHKGEDPEP
jgi:hypothetical protein